MRLRFSIRALMGLVILVAVGFAALLSATPLWVSLLFSGLIFGLATVTLGAALLEGRGRGFCAGMAFFGWGYLYLASAEGTCELLVTSKLFDAIDQLLSEPAEAISDATFLRRVYLDLTGVVPSTEEMSRFVADPNPGKRAEVVDRLVAGPDEALRVRLAGLYGLSQWDAASFRQIEHLLLALIVALTGGIIARRFQAVREERISVGGGS